MRYEERDLGGGEMLQGNGQVSECGAVPVERLAGDQNVDGSALSGIRGRGERRGLDGVKRACIRMAKSVKGRLHQRLGCDCHRLTASRPVLAQHRPRVHPSVMSDMHSVRHNVFPVNGLGLADSSWSGH
jgi:hypothetical protein